MAKITFIIENDSGEVLDRAEASMSAEALQWSIDAIADAHSYNADEHGVTKERFLSWMIRLWVERQVDRYAGKLAAAAAAAQAAAIKSTVVVPPVGEE